MIAEMLSTTEQGKYFWNENLDFCKVSLKDSPVKSFGSLSKSTFNVYGINTFLFSKGYTSFTERFAKK